MELAYKGCIIRNAPQAHQAGKAVADQQRIILFSLCAKSIQHTIGTAPQLRPSAHLSG